MFARTITENAELRPLEPWQAAEFLAHVDKARANIEPYIPWAELVVDEESARAFLQRYAVRQAEDAGRLYGIWLDGELVGGLLFRTFEPRWGSSEIGVWLDGHAEGHGLVTRSAQVLIDWALGDRGMNRVEWRCVPANARSVAVAQRLGMTLEGTLRQAFPYRDQIHDLQIWSLLRSEWEARAER
ncbi:RimJ/RimL family protein N-acetyltransferase [Kribbella amoyensis]|uniref:RimJ/RimL family protein N-acetyltransferase n=1 Tax=Kribbella amoyensis TaxID=996641 RepID=A0A561BM62_9ACTN|nr:GNAT family protein [Kribbella amoyensis]TWD79923.1 RimJ/RimL family protein N-acetyltransferase [Kribbella amoyensis]